VQLITTDASANRLGIVEENDFCRFLTEATQAIGLDFIVNVVQTGKKRSGQGCGWRSVSLKRGEDGSLLYEVEIDHPERSWSAE